MIIDPHGVSMKSYGQGMEEQALPEQQLRHLLARHKILAVVPHGVYSLVGMGIDWGATTSASLFQV